MSGHHHGHDHHSGHAGGTARAVAISLTVNVMLTILKWAAYLVTWSPSLFGEAAHSTADTLNPLLLWFGYRRSRRPRDESHPFGHGREAFFWSLMAAQMMFVVGAAATAYHGIESLATGLVPEMSWWAGGIMLFALVAEGYSFVVSWRNVRASNHDGGATAGDAARSKNPIVLALIIENGADMLGVLFAVCGYGLYLATGQPIWDGIFSLCIALLLACSSIFLIRRNLSLIVGEGADGGVEERVRHTLTKLPTVLQVKGVVTEVCGPDEIRCRVIVSANYQLLAKAWQADHGELPNTATTEAFGWLFTRLHVERTIMSSALKEALPELAEVEIDLA